MIIFAAQSCSSLGNKSLFMMRSSRCLYPFPVFNSLLPVANGIPQYPYHFQACDALFHIICRGNTASQKPMLPDNKTMSAQEILIEEIRRQPEPVAREVLHYLKFLERQRAQEDWADVLPSREVEQEKLDLLDGK
jgi:hypothetical protein